MKCKFSMTVRIGLLTASVLFVGCNRTPPPVATVQPPGQTPAENITALLEDVASNPADAKWLLNPDRPFSIEKREREMSAEDCASCHEPEKPVEVDPSSKTHEFTLHHGRPDQLDCKTCHKPLSPFILTAGATETATFDHTYKQCATCHFQQARDWQGGAHGKRLVGWTGPRVIRDCTACHNPHNPIIPSKMPVAQPTIARKGLSHE